jgi:hypothetical protein
MSESKNKNGFGVRGAYFSDEQFHCFGRKKKNGQGNDFTFSEYCFFLE